MSVQRTPMTRPGYERLREEVERLKKERPNICLLYTSPSPRD